MQTNNLLGLLKKDYPKIIFVSGKDFVWSPKNNNITYDVSIDSHETLWSLIHEVAHAKLGHSNYTTDSSLIKLELEAWREAKLIAKNYKMTINQDHIEDCLDTYRDWLSQRASCPKCDVVGLQQNDKSYKCINCPTVWRVPGSAICKIVKKQLKPTQT